MQEHERPTTLRGKTPKIRTGCGNLYLTINRHNGKIVEVFAKLGKSGGCAGAFNEGIARMIALALREGATVEDIVDQLRWIRCSEPNGLGAGLVTSCPDAIAQLLERELKEEANGDTA